MVRLIWELKIVVAWVYIIYVLHDPNDFLESFKNHKTAIFQFDALTVKKEHAILNDLWFLNPKVSYTLTISSFSFDF